MSSLMPPVVNAWGQPVGAPVASWTPRPWPEPEALAGRWCRLEPLRVAHADALWTALCGPANDPLWTYLPMGPFADRPALEAALGALVADPAWAPLVITRNGDEGPVGMASYLRIDPVNGCAEVGAIVFGPALRRTPAATEAMYLMARHVLDDLGYRRFEWKCDALNAPSVAAARRLGFRPEGVWRQALVVKGRNRDTAWFSITDGDWARLRPVLEAWLAPESFEDGVQRWPLSAATAAVHAE